MEVETDLEQVDKELKLVLQTAEEYTHPGNVISNCMLLFGSPEGDCGKCTKPCLHPLATQDLEAYFHNPNIIKLDWIDDTACIMVCTNPSIVEQITQSFFEKVFTEENGLEWYRSQQRVEKISVDDNYGEKGTSIFIFARNCLSSDIERLQDLRKAKMVNNIIKRRKELKKASVTVKKKDSKKKRQRMNKKRIAKEKEEKIIIEEQVDKVV